MKPLTGILVLDLIGCAVQGGARPAGMGQGMGQGMCSHHAAEPGRAASAPASMREGHCTGRAEAPAAAASHAH